MQFFSQSLRKYANVKICKCENAQSVIIEMLLFNLEIEDNEILFTEKNENHSIYCGFHLHIFSFSHLLINTPSHLFLP
jgi:hypothetical protein